MSSWDTEQEQVISKFIHTKPNVLYDIGVGPKSEYLTLKNLYPYLRIFGCEPNKRLYKQLLDSFPGLLLPFALAEKIGQAILYIPEEDMCSSLLSINNLYKEKQAYKVHTITLDLFDVICGEQNNIILWMDVEGYEEIILQHGLNLLSSGRVKWINLEEIHANMTGWPRQWSKREHIDALLAKYGYVRVLEYNRHETNQDVIYELHI